MLVSILEINKPRLLSQNTRAVFQGRGLNPNRPKLIFIRESVIAVRVNIQGERGGEMLDFLPADGARLYLSSYRCTRVTLFLLIGLVNAGIRVILNNGFYP